MKPEKTWSFAVTVQRAVAILVISMLERIISGGQTGVDRAALDAALRLNFPCGGWCPRGRRAEDGIIPSRYPLKETQNPEYEVRTELNVKEADGTLVLTRGKPRGGTALTINLARDYGKPCLVLDLLKVDEKSAVSIRDWIEENHIRVLNVAGPRESENPGIYEKATALIEKVIL